MKTIATFVFVGSSLFVAVACSTATNDSVQYCDPEAPFPGLGCRTEADAGPDAETSDAGSDGSSNAHANICPGRCVPVPDKNQAGLWSPVPISLWVGPADFLPCCPGSKGCAAPPGHAPVAEIDTVPNEFFRVYDKLIAPPAACEPCECGPSEGTCTGLPASIEIRAGLCGDASATSVPFNGPSGWDGSCSNSGGLAAGAMCNGVPCAQSVWASPLPGPTTESCTPKSVTPNFKVETKWEMGAVACQGNTRDDDCGSASNYCLNDPGPGWLFCIYREGVHDKECPENYRYAPYVMHQPKVKDDRGCETCSCGAPSGSGCLGEVQAYKDGACQDISSQVQLGSMFEGCQNVQPGIALGSKEVTGLGYMSGSCAAMGGAPKGNVVAEDLDALTFCCAPAFDIAK